MNETDYEREKESGRDMQGEKDSPWNIEGERQKAFR